MNILLLCHPQTLASMSMPRVARFLGEGMKSRGHEVSYLTSRSWFGKFSLRNQTIKKWLGYVDQFLVFPQLLKRRLAQEGKIDLVVVSDQALGMWVPYIKHLPHVIHCMDFMALKSSLGEYPENKTSWTGKQYQSLIRKGFSSGNHFVSISKNTQSELDKFLFAKPKLSKVVYLGLNSDFRPVDNHEFLSVIPSRLHPNSHEGFFLHVGGNQWYKNRKGVIELYRDWCNITDQIILPLWMVGPPPNEQLAELMRNVPRGGSVEFITDFDDVQVRAAYGRATVTLFPSLAEGFGWPIAEAMACGSAVITTNEAPMTEVGGNAAVYIPRRPFNDNGEWSRYAALVVERLIKSSPQDKVLRKESGFRQAQKFKASDALDQYEEIYKTVFSARF